MAFCRLCEGEGLCVDDACIAVECSADRFDVEMAGRFYAPEDNEEYFWGGIV